MANRLLPPHGPPIALAGDVVFMPHDCRRRLPTFKYLTQRHAL
jgi:hypothetical protein